MAVAVAIGCTYGKRVTPIAKVEPKPTVSAKELAKTHLSHKPLALFGLLSVHQMIEDAIAKYMRIDSRSCMTVARGPLP
jgi:hypothetical protein